MRRNRWAAAACPLLLLVLGMALVGCQSEMTPQPTPSQQTLSHYWTALEAYERVKPTMLAWHEDAVVLAVMTTNVENAPGRWQIARDGTASHWGFDVCSPIAGRRTAISLEGDNIEIGVDGLPDVQGSCDQGLPIDQMIDTDEAMRIVTQSGVGESDFLVSIWTTRVTTRYDAQDLTHIPLSWEFTFGDRWDPTEQNCIYVNAITGEVVLNEFAQP